MLREANVIVPVIAADGASRRPAAAYGERTQNKAASSQSVNYYVAIRGAARTSPGM
jgi:hypothetical protein